MYKTGTVKKKKMTESTVAKLKIRITCRVITAFLRF